jgi:hypothetical protein
MTKEFRVGHSPQGDEPIDCAHSSVDYPLNSLKPPAKEPSKAQRKLLKYELSRMFKIAYGDVKTPKPDGA